MHRLRYFLRVADDGSLTRASDVLGIAQPALSRQIRLLEEALGVQLFARTPRGMQLTEEGEQLRSAIAGPLSQVELAMQNIGSPWAQTGGGVVLGMPETAAWILAAPLLGRLSRRFPKVQVATVVSHTRDLVERMLAGEVDIALIGGPSPDERLFTSELLVEDLVLVGDRDCSLSPAAPRVFADLAHIPLVLPRSELGLRGLLVKTALAQSVSLNVRFETDSVGLQRNLIVAGDVFGILPLSVIRHDVQAGRLRYAPLRDPVVRDQLFIAVRPHLILPRRFVLEFSSLIWQEATSLIEAGQWNATLQRTPQDWIAPQSGAHPAPDQMS
jgi:DNA-binding transcriptional LysR family regulator